MGDYDLLHPHLGAEVADAYDAVHAFGDLVKVTEALVFFGPERKKGSGKVNKCETVRVTDGQDDVASYIIRELTSKLRGLHSKLRNATNSTKIADGKPIELGVGTSAKINSGRSCRVTSGPTHISVPHRYGSSSAGATTRRRPSSPAR